MDICRKYKENTQIIHAIEAHHGDVEPKTPLAFIIQAADAISAARPGARRENVESYVKRLENLEEISSSFEGVEQAFAVQAGREVRILVKPDVISDDQSSCWHAPSPKRSRIRWITPARSRSTSSARAALWSTQNKAFSAGCRVFCTAACFFTPKRLHFPLKKVSWMQKKAKRTASVRTQTRNDPGTERSIVL